MGEQSTDVHINPVKILSKLEEIMSEESIIVADGGDFVGTAAYILRCNNTLESASLLNTVDCTCLLHTHTIQQHQMHTDRLYTHS